MDPIMPKNLTTRVLDVRGLYDSKEEAKKALGDTLSSSDIVIINEYFEDVDEEGNKRSWRELRIYVYILDTDEFVLVPLVQETEEERNDRLLKEAHFNEFLKSLEDKQS